MGSAEVSARFFPSTSIISSTRTFTEQKQIWENKWNGKTLVDGKNLALTSADPIERAKIILRYSSMPGSSRHHWGSDIDLNSLDPKWFATTDGQKLYAWLSTHAKEFGFCQPYSAKGTLRPDGYEEEKWHWSYLPIALPMLAAYRDSIHYADIIGFAGSETAPKIKIIESYVLGIAEECGGG